MKTFADIKQELDTKKLIEYGDDKDYLDYRRQWLHLVDDTSESEQYQAYKKFFKQKTDGKYILLPINSKGQVSLQRSKALQKLLDEGYIRMSRRPKLYLNGWGWKSSDLKHRQTYLQYAGE